MKKSALRALQGFLAALGDYDGAVDGLSGPRTARAVGRLLGRRAAELAGDPAAWPPARRAVAAYQMMMRDRGVDVGPLDGLWGPQTEFADGALAEILSFGAEILFRDRPAPARRRGAPAWPAEGPGQAGLRAAFGPPGGEGGQHPPLVAVDCPWTLRLAWDPAVKLRTIRCHEKVAESLSRVLQAVRAAYAPRELRALRLNRYGGCYNPRKKRGGDSWSTHAWGVALDFDPARNRLRWGRDRARLARPEYDAWWAAWEAEGWVSLGRAKNFDWMHVQAAAA